MNIPDEVREALQGMIAHILLAESIGGMDVPERKQEARMVRQWLDAQPKAPSPDWSQAPNESVIWWSVDANGSVNWGQGEPYEDADLGRWVDYDGATWDGGTIDIRRGVDWRLLKAKRPEVTPCSTR